MNHIQQSQHILEAAHYIKHGLKLSIIQQYSPLSVKYLRKLTKEITGEPPLSGRLTTVSRLFRNKRYTMLSMLLISIYLKAAHPFVKKVELTLLFKVFDHFKEQVVSFEAMSEMASDFTINDAWVLVDAYLHQSVSLEPCGCGNFIAVSEVYELNSRCTLCGAEYI